MYTICLKKKKKQSGAVLQILQSQKSLHSHSFYLNHSWRVILCVSLLSSIQKESALKTTSMHYITPGTTQ